MLHEFLAGLTEQVVPIIDLVALIFIVFGVVEACANIIKVRFVQYNESRAVRAVWMQLSRWLVAGLTFQLAADIIETSIAPSWEEIGQLGAIAVIRTFLDFFLGRDQREVRELQQEAQVHGST